MTQETFNQFYVELANGNIDFSNDTFKIALFTESYTPDVNTQENFSDISANESTGSGYTQGGLVVGNILVTKDNANYRANITGDNVLFDNVTLSYRYAVLYKDSGTPTTSPLIKVYDRGNEVTLSGDSANIIFDGGVIGRIQKLN